MLLVKKIKNERMQKIFSIIVIFVISITIVGAAYLKVGAVISCSTVSECEAIKKAKEDEKTAYQTELARLGSEADTLSNALAKLSSEKSVIQAQIDINQAEYRCKDVEPMGCEIFHKI